MNNADNESPSIVSRNNYKKMEEENKKLEDQIKNSDNVIEEAKIFLKNSESPSSNTEKNTK